MSYDLVTFDSGSPVEAAHIMLDQLELLMLGQPQTFIDLPLKHKFTPGLYIREILIPAGTFCTTRIHKVQHPYVILKGKVSIYIPYEGITHLEAPYSGITEVGTKRVIYAHEDTIWITYHPNEDNSTDLEVLEDKLIERRELIDNKTANECYEQILNSLQSGLLSDETNFVGAP